MMDALILMTRVPVPGKTKTRLMEILSGEECAQIHRCFLLDLFNMLNRINLDIDVFLSYTPDPSFSIMADMIPDDIECFPQRGEGLGERMLNAIDDLFKRNYDKVVLIGTDIPDIQPVDIKKAFAILDHKDVCLGPTADGGYYLIGMKQLYPELFGEQLKWGNRSVFESTVDIGNRQNLKVGLCSKHRDIDTKEDLFALKEGILNGGLDEQMIPKNTFEFIKKCWSGAENVKGIING